MHPEPTTIGRYQIQHRIGHGAMGMVFLAQDPLLKRPVAIKIVKDVGEDRALTMDRFQREAEISARLNHPNIVTVFDVGEDPQVGPFLAMEFIDGGSLARLIKSRLPLDMGLRLMIQGMGAILAAESAGIIHRDIKPENILVSKDGRFKLMDFGIARRDESHLTQTGMMVGTPSYTAPELLIGGEATPVTDRYAFAITVFEVVTGLLPFRSTSVGSTLYRIVHEPPTIPESMNPALVAVFSKALAKAPEERYQDLPSFMAAVVRASGLADDLKVKLLDYVEGDSPYSGTQEFPTLVPGADPVAPHPPDSAPSGMDSGEAEHTRAVNARANPAAVLRQSGPMPLETRDGADKFAKALVPSSGQESEPTAPKPPMYDPPVPAIKEPVAPFKKPIPWTPRTLVLAGAVLLVLLGARLVVMTPKSTHVLEVNSAPAGADVVLDGKLQGTTPLKIEVGKGQGKLLRLEKGGYQPRTQEVKPGDRNLLVVLEAASSAIAVVTDPPGAEVYLNGILMGRTPLPTLPIPSGNPQRMSIKLDGYEEWTAELDLDLPFPPLIRMSPTVKARKKR